MTRTQDALDETFVDGLAGKHTHVQPTTALRHLSPSLARKRPSDDTHSCWEILHHMVVWQDYTIKMLSGDKTDWREISTVEWPTKDELLDDDGWEKLVARFSSGTKELEEIIRTTDLSKSVPTWPEGPSGAWILVIIQHNSYHVGQIVVVRTLLGHWPPPKTADET